MRFVQGLQIVRVACCVQLSQNFRSRRVSEFYYEERVCLLECDSITHVSHETGGVEILALAQAFQSSHDLEVTVEHVDVCGLPRASSSPTRVGSGRDSEVSLKLIHGELVQYMSWHCSSRLVLDVGLAYADPVYCSLLRGIPSWLC